LGDKIYFDLGAFSVTVQSLAAFGIHRLIAGFRAGMILTERSGVWSACRLMNESIKQGPPHVYYP
jgi:hypothetical protein